MSFFRAIWRSGSKHKKLYDEWALAGSNEMELEDQSEETSFNLKYIGSTLVESATSEEATAEAVKAILSLAKASGKKMTRVIVSVSLKGIKIVNSASNDTQLEVSIYRISYCSADANHSQVFAFIATNPDDSLECHAYMCPKRKVAQTVSLTVAQMFNTAFEMWQLAQDQFSYEHSRELAKKALVEREAQSENFETSNRPVQTPVRTTADENKGLLIDLESATQRGNANWVNFDSESITNVNNFSRFASNGNFDQFFQNRVTTWDNKPINLMCS